MNSEGVVVGNDKMWIEECLCPCQYEDSEPLTRGERLVEALKILFIASVATSVAALAAIGALSVWLSVYFA